MRIFLLLTASLDGDGGRGGEGGLLNRGML